ncbi:EpsG family protein [Ursidibacter sp. B-7004-1]
MLPYIALVSSITIMTLFDKKRGGHFIFFALVSWMFVFSAFRVGGTGSGDYEAYLRLYNSIDSWEKVINPDVHTELGFRIISLGGNLLGAPEQFIIVTMAILSVFPVIYIIYKYSPYKILSLLIWMPYFFTMNMHASRTSVAAGFGVLFFIFYFQRYVLLMLCSFVLSVSFHTSALVLLLVILSKLSFRMLFWVTIMVLILSLLITPIQILINFLHFLGFLEISSSIEAYIISDDYGYSMSLYDPRIIIGIIIVLLIYNNRKLCENYFKLDYFKLYVIGMIIMLLCSDVTIMSWRVSYFFLIISVIVLPWIAKMYDDKINEKIKVNRLMSLIIGFAYILYTLPIIWGAKPYEFLF